MHDDPAPQRGEIRIGVEPGGHARQRVGRREFRVVVQADDEPPVAESGAHVPAARHAVVAAQSDQSRVDPPAHRRRESCQRSRARTLIHDDDVA